MSSSSLETRKLLSYLDRLPPTPESPAEPTFLPHVREPLPSLISSPTPAPLPATSAKLSPSTPNTAVLAGLNVLLHERDALTNLHHIYSTEASAQHALAQCVAVIACTVRNGGRLVVSGVGKSGRIGEKVVATCNSLGVRAAWLHATEAMHGDLGMLGPHDTLLLITYSATTPELLAFAPHIPPSLPLIVLTASLSCSPLLDERPAEACTNIVLPAPIPVSEAAAFGVAAPTSSTTVALALGDALALAVAEQLHAKPADVFRRCHPGGTIGKAR